MNDSNMSDSHFDENDCGYPGCDFKASSKRDMANHRRKLGHPKQRDPVDAGPSDQNGFNDDDDIDVDLHVNLEPEIELSTPETMDNDHRKHVCDSCGYRSQYRQNLDRHCKRKDHFSFELIR